MITIGVNAYMAAILVAIIRVVGGVLAIFLIKKLPRVRLMMITMTLMALSMAVLGGVIYLEERGADSAALRCGINLPAEGGRVCENLP